MSFITVKFLSGRCVWQAIEDGDDQESIKNTLISNYSNGESVAGWANIDNILEGTTDSDIIVGGDGYLTIDYIISLKRQLCAAVDVKTTSLISCGFRYPDNVDGQIFSLSAAAQSNLHGVYARINDDDLFPLDWATISDDDIFVINDSNAFENFHKVAFDHIKNLRVEGLSIKRSIREAVTIDDAQSAYALDIRDIAW